MACVGLSNPHSQTVLDHNLQKELLQSDVIWWT